MFRSTLICLATVLAGLVSLVASATTAAGQPQQGTTMRWTIDGVRRDALVFAPRTTQGAAKHPLVIAFHGHGGHMQSTSARMHIQTLWPQAIVVYPQGVNTSTGLDPAGTKSGWQGKAGEFGDRDLKLFDAIVATMKLSYRVDKRRIYATGFSNGAVFSLLLWAKRAKTIAAVGEVAGRLDPSETLTSARRASGRGGATRHGGPVRSPDSRRSSKPDRSIARPSWESRAASTARSTRRGTAPLPVKTFIHPGGHVYPLWAPKAIVEFFKSHVQP